MLRMSQQPQEREAFTCASTAAALPIPLNAVQYQSKTLQQLQAFREALASHLSHLPPFATAKAALTPLALANDFPLKVLRATAQRHMLHSHGHDHRI